MENDERFDAPADLVLEVLREKARSEPLLRAWLGEASWKAAALVERASHNGALSTADDGPV